jgi:hypothetical protein
MKGSTAITTVPLLSVSWPSNLAVPHLDVWSPTGQEYQQLWHGSASAPGPRIELPKPVHLSRMGRDHQGGHPVLSAGHLLLGRR